MQFSSLSHLHFICSLFELCPTNLGRRKGYHFFTFFKLNPSLSLFPPETVEKVYFCHYFYW